MPILHLHLALRVQEELEVIGIRVAEVQFIPTPQFLWLHYFVHMEVEDAENMLVSIQVTIPEDVQIEMLDLTELPNNWRDIPAPTALATIRDNWFDLGTYSTSCDSVSYHFSGE